MLNEENIDLKIGNIQRFFLNIFKKYWLKISIIILLTIVVRFCLVFGVGLILSQILEKIAFNNFSLKNGVGFWFIIMTSMESVAFFLSFLSGYLQSKIFPEILKNVNNDLFQKVQNINLEDFFSRGDGALVNNINGITEPLNAFLQNFINNSCPRFVILVTCLIDFASTNIYLFLLCFFYIYLYLFIFLKLFPNVENSLKENYKQNNKRANFLADSLKNTLLKKIFLLEDYENDKIKSTQEEVTDYEKIAFVKMNFYQSSLDILSIIYFSIFFLINYLLLLNGKLNSGTLVQVNMCNFSLYYAIWAEIKAFSNVKNWLNKINCSLDFIDSIKTEKKTGIVIPTHDFKGNILIKNLKFSYGKSIILENFSLEIKAGQKIVIMGPSGVGKSTILNLLNKMLTPQEGNIYIDGIDISQIETDFLRRNVHYITQANMVLNSTIRENILLGKLEATEDEIIVASKKAKLHEMVENMPLKYDSPVGNGGSLLSGGQLQRLAIARTILGMHDKSGILLCDEATSALDIFTAKDVLDSIFDIAKDKTVFFVDHSFLIAPKSDLVIIINSFDDIVVGNHFDLLKNCPSYCDVFARH